jgi:hypothetical protein
VIYDANYAALVAYAMRRVGTAEDAADVVAETMLIAWRRLDDVPPDDEARLWLYGTARRVLANQRRAAVRRLRLNDELATEFAVARARQPDPLDLDLGAAADALGPLSQAASPPLGVGEQDDATRTPFDRSSGRAARSQRRRPGAPDRLVDDVRLHTDPLRGRHLQRATPPAPGAARAAAARFTAAARLSCSARSRRSSSRSRSSRARRRPPAAGAAVGVKARGDYIVATITDPNAAESQLRTAVPREARLHDGALSLIERLVGDGDRAELLAARVDEATARSAGTFEFTGSVLRANFWLLLGMVRANQPARRRGDVARGDRGAGDRRIRAHVAEHLVARRPDERSAPRGAAADLRGAHDRGADRGSWPVGAPV